MWIEDPWTRAAIPLPDGWTALPGRGALPLLATDRSGGDGVFAPTVVVAVTPLVDGDTVATFAERHWQAWRKADATVALIAAMDGELDGRLVRETLVSSMVGSSGVSTITHYLTVDGLGVRFDVSVESWNTRSAREMARSILAQARLPVRAPDGVSPEDTLGPIIDLVLAEGGLDDRA